MFEDREQAGDLLALKLKKIINPSAGSGQGGFVVVSLLRGGIILGKRISDCFNLPQKPLVVKKIGAPFNPELGIGAVTVDKTYYFNEEIIRDLNISTDYRKKALENKYKEAKLLQEKIEKNIEKISYKEKTAIVVDDGVAIGNTVICASIYLKKQKVKKIILATPVISKDGVSSVKSYFDRVVSLKIVSSFSAIGEFYRYFPQVSEEEVFSHMV
jgi:predicted phosphoribosyltransferase